MTKQGKKTRSNKEKENKRELSESSSTKINDKDKR